MSGQGPITPRWGVSPSHLSATDTNIQGDYSGNSGSHNIMNSGNTNHYYGNTNSLPSDSEILQCLYTSRYQSHRRRVREPAEGTCSWVTEHPKYKDWLGKQTSGLLWLSADPGCGKSVIDPFLISHLGLNTDAIICYFFFKDDSEEQKTATFALSAILHQLFYQRNILCRYGVRAFKAKGKAMTEEVDTLWDVLVTAVADGGCGEVICVVDALDECEGGSLALLTRCLASLPGSQTPDIPLKFLVTGRPYHRIERALGLRASTIRLRGEDEVNSISADVARVIDEGIKDLESYWQQPGGLGYLRKLLESSADRTFLWVSLILEILRESADDSQEGFTNLVSNVPHDLAELYTRILDKSNDPDQARRILRIVVAAVRPLTLREINIAFRIRRDHTAIGDISPQSEATVKNSCGLFVRIIDSKVYLIHQTAREFLIKGSLPGHGNWQYTLCPINSSFILADICIMYLSLQEFESDPLVVDTLGIPKREAIGDYVQKYGLLDYAATHWAGHFRDSESGQMDLFERSTLICGRGSNRFLTWFMVFWENSGYAWYHPFPHDFTHLMVASWTGQRSVVKQLLKQRESIDDRSERYGTALNVAALSNERDIAKMLMKGGVNAYLNGKEYNILLTRRSELDDLEREQFQRKQQQFRQLDLQDQRDLQEFFDQFDLQRQFRRQLQVIEFLIPFSIRGVRDLYTLPSRLISSLR